MFGYVRPDKGELLVREFVRFRAVYCGICKTIGKKYGQIQRLALTYDITMLGVLMVSLAEIEFKEKMDRCILNPVTKKPMMVQNEVLERCAALSVMLAYGKFQDEIRDERPVKGQIGRRLFRNAYLKAKKSYPDDAALIDGGLKKLHLIEEQNVSSKPYVDAANAFGDILESLFRESFNDYFADVGDRKVLLREGISKMGYYIGEWIFMIDAVDDYEHDKTKGNWNPFMNESRDDSKKIAQELMTGYETQIDQIAALLPYKRDAGIISNIFQNGMPLVRQKIFAGQKLARL